MHSWVESENNLVESVPSYCEGHEGYTPGCRVPTEPSCPMQYMHIEAIKISSHSSQNLPSVTSARLFQVYRTMLVKKRSPLWEGTLPVS